MYKQVGTYLIAKEMKIDRPSLKTKRYIIENKDHEIQLGIVKWYPSWRQYCFFPTTEIVLSAGCMKDIREFVLDLNAEHREK